MIINFLHLIKNKNKGSEIIPLYKILFPNAVEAKDEIEKEDEDFISNTLSPDEQGIPTCKYEEDLITYVKNFKLTRKVDTLIWHCTASNPNASINSILNHWKSIGWKNPGYHILVKPSGEWTLLSDFNNIVNGAKGYNSRSINISYIGGIDTKGKPLNNITEKQKRIFCLVTKMLQEQIKNLNVIGHNEISNKACPSFNVKEFLKNDFKNYI